VAIIAQRFVLYLDGMFITKNIPLL